MHIIKNRHQKATAESSSPRRMLNADGTSRVVRLNDSGDTIFNDLGHLMLTVHWITFLGLVGILYLIINVVFAILYLTCGDGIENAKPGSFFDAFFFSVQTLATIGYGKLVPHGLIANCLVTVEALCGMVLVAVVAGLAYARFTHPTAGLMFSTQPVIGRFGGKPTLMLRMANRRANTIIDTTASLVLVRFETDGEGTIYRRFHDLALVRSNTPVFSLSWTVMHCIDETSPLFCETAETLARDEAEFLLVVTGHHEGFAELVHARHAYGYDDIQWNSRFADIFVELPDGRRAIDLAKFNQIEPLKVDSKPRYFELDSF